MNNRHIFLFVATSALTILSVTPLGAQEQPKTRQNVVSLLAQADRALPRAPKDWKVELVAQTPKLHYPSVVTREQFADLIAYLQSLKGTAKK